MVIGSSYLEYLNPLLNVFIHFMFLAENGKITFPGFLLVLFPLILFMHLEVNQDIQIHEENLRSPSFYSILEKLRHPRGKDGPMKDDYQGLVIINAKRCVSQTPFGDHTLCVLFPYSKGKNTKINPEKVIFPFFAGNIKGMNTLRSGFGSSRYSESIIIFA